MDTPAELLAAARRAEPARPFVVYYDDAVGPEARVELSLTTLDNWVSKTANLLQDEFGAEPGERLGLRLPTHWLGMVWMLAGWSVGMVVDLDGLAPSDGASPGSGSSAGRSSLDIAATSPEHVDVARAAGARDVAAVAVQPFGGRLGSDLPAGVVDYGGEVLSHGDVFRPVRPPQPDDPALVADGRTFTGRELVTAAREVAAEAEDPGGRVMTAANPAGPDGWLEALLAPLATQGSVVLVHAPDRSVLAARAEAEKVTRTTIDGIDRS